MLSYLDYQNHWHPKNNKEHKITLPFNFAIFQMSLGLKINIRNQKGFFLTRLIDYETAVH